MCFCCDACLRVEVLEHLGEGLGLELAGVLLGAGVDELLVEDAADFVRLRISHIDRHSRTQQTPWARARAYERSVSSLPRYEFPRPFWAIGGEEAAAMQQTLIGLDGDVLDDRTCWGE